MLFSKKNEYDQELPQSQTADHPMATREEPLNHQVLKTQSWLRHLLIHVLFKRMVNIDLVNMVGIYTIDVSMMSTESKENSNS